VLVAPKSQYPRQLRVLVEQLDLPALPELIRRFLYDQLQPDAILPGAEVDLDQCPLIRPGIRLYVVPSAIAKFYAPSDPSGIGGMYCERIRATSSWYRGAPRNDCIFVTKDSDLKGLRGLHVARVRFFFRFTYEAKKYSCALVQWFSPIGDAPCKDTGMWIAEPDLDHNGIPVEAVIHVDCILRGALLIPVYGEEFLLRHITFSNSLGAFRSYYVNKFADHHANEIAF
jgi:hypothetical protein